jgi:putative peptidoglycan lipid II flippase
MATAAAVQCYALGLVGYSAARIALPVFYALGRSRVAVMLSVTSIAVNLMLSMVLVRTLGFRGLALATSGAALVNGGLSVVLLRRRLGGIDGSRLAATFGKVLIASTVMAVVVVGAAHVMSAWTPGTGAPVQMLRLGVDILAGLVALTAASAWLGVREFDEAREELRARVRALLMR